MEKIAKIFSFDEIKSSRTLQIIYWVMLLGFFIAFTRWLPMDNVTVSAFENGTYSCPYYFQSCGNLYFFENGENGYSQLLFYSILYTCMVISGIFAIRKCWDLALIFIVPAFIWQALMALLLTNSISVPWQYFHLTFTFILLFFPGKINSLRIIFVLLYVLSGTVKFSEGWILGTYFTSLKLGLPFVSDSLVPIFTNFVIVLELCGSWFLLSQNKKLRHGVAFTYTVFHLYSIVLVGFRYPTHCLPVLLALFTDLFEKNKTNHRALDLRYKKYLPVFVLVLLIGFFHLIPYLIAGDYRVTGQGNRLTLNMFDNNRQCLITKRFVHKDGYVDERVRRSYFSTYRCFPYDEWFVSQRDCQRDIFDRIEFKFTVSSNGGPFYEIVNEKNLCELSFDSKRHNDWIRLDMSEEIIKGYPRKNSVWTPDRDENKQIVYSNQKIHMTGLQKLIKEFFNEFLLIYYFLFCMSVISMVYIVFFKGKKLQID